MIVAHFEVPGMTSSQYDAIMNELKTDGKFPTPNCLSHVSYEKDGIMHAVDTWTSMEALLEYGQHALSPIFGRMGITPPQPQINEAHSFIVP